MDPLAKNFYALYEIITADKEYLPEHIFIKHGLIDITLDELKETETMEMKRLSEPQGQVPRSKKTDHGSCPHGSHGSEILRKHRSYCTSRDDSPLNHRNNPH